jgi:EF-P beta-lysylation protein EpmB
MVMAPGVLQKYPGRVLLIAAKSCAVNCRYCFRRAFPYEDGPTSRDEWSESLAAISADPSIEEVILSGGDPLINLDDALAWLIGELSGIGHVRRLRIHTRFPIVIPQRVTDQFVEVLAECQMPITFVVHVNHAQELDDNVARAMNRLRSIPQLILLNQSVLLRGVNDSVASLTALSWRLLELGIVPYYLHQLDRVTGADHFEVTRDEGLKLMATMRESLPGYAVPRYAEEVAGEQSKVVLA